MSDWPAVFLDRDGTIMVDAHYPKDPEQVELLPNAVAGLKRMREKGYLLFVVSNQSGVGRGLIDDDQFLAVHKRIGQLLYDAGVDIIEYAYCLHHPLDRCGCRKPAAGLVPRTHLGRPLDLKKSWVIGDRQSDLELAKSIGATPVLVLSGEGAQTRDHLAQSGQPLTVSVCRDLLEVAEELPPV